MDSHIGGPKKFQSPVFVLHVCLTQNGKINNSKINNKSADDVIMTSLHIWDASTIPYLSTKFQYDRIFPYMCFWKKVAKLIIQKSITNQPMTS